MFQSFHQHGQRHPSELFAQTVAMLVKRCAHGAGLDTAKYAGRLPRSGLVTVTAAAGASERSSAAQTGHRLRQMLRRPMRDGSFFRGNEVAVLGL